MTSKTFSVQAGPQLLGYFLNWALLGVLLTQVYLYYLWFPEDSKIMKCLVYGLAIFETIQTSLTTAAAFDQYIYSDGDISRVDTFPFVWFAVPIMAAITAAVVQIFYAWRIFMMLTHSSHSLRSLNYILPVIVVILALLQLGAGTAGGVKIGQAATAADLGPADASLTTWLVGAAVNDVVIAVAMTILLLRAKIGIARMDAILSGIICLSVETGSLTATLAIVAVILIALPSLKQTLLYQAPAPVITKIYANSLMVNLNNRAFIRKNVMLSFVEPIRISRIDAEHSATIEWDTEDSMRAEHGSNERHQGGRTTENTEMRLEDLKAATGGSMTFQMHSQVSNV
ncbi:uncharacterized protein LAESUDRAFT_810135 [Laetiporus sulphureus 93-53]|uniref:DUF6534 domain-containing protein n=1 Tax=Laetiporus sulphureus 93-53 TaxID=1314785 RepID=A0A165GLV1_9APHY|nr:uncharacterized protein LAESUDRAFT_810135 [Laetiporus sulphureus 93-53]KZT10529.1 hypothetical protein LAESUDRAFT_810135 [Laetiporus sulphureus 93-53]